MSNDKYYSNTAARLDTIIGGDQTHLNQLIAAREEFSNQHCFEVYVPWEKFYAWLDENYGIRMRMTTGGMLELDYDVIDEKKYMMFVLKFSGNA